MHTIETNAAYLPVPAVLPVLTELYQELATSHGGSDMARKVRTEALLAMRDCVADRDRVSANQYTAALTLASDALGRMARCEIWQEWSTDIRPHVVGWEVHVEPIDKRGTVRVLPMPSRLAADMEAQRLWAAGGVLTFVRPVLATM